MKRKNFTKKKKKNKKSKKKINIINKHTKKKIKSRNKYLQKYLGGSRRGRADRFDSLIRTASLKAHNQGQSRVCYAYAIASAIKMVIEKFDQMGFAILQGILKIPSTSDLRKIVLDIVEEKGIIARPKVMASVPGQGIIYVMKNKVFGRERKDTTSTIIRAVIQKYPIYANLIDNIEISFDMERVWNIVSSITDEKLVGGVVINLLLSYNVWLEFDSKDIITLEQISYNLGDKYSPTTKLIGHAMVITGCGISNGKKNFIIKNSHGCDFGWDGWLQVELDVLESQWINYAGCHIITGMG